MEPVEDEVVVKRVSAAIMNDLIGHMKYDNDCRFYVPNEYFQIDVHCVTDGNGKGTFDVTMAIKRHGFITGDSKSEVFRISYERDADVVFEKDIKPFVASLWNQRCGNAQRNAGKKRSKEL